MSGLSVNGIMRCRREPANRVICVYTFFFFYRCTKRGCDRNGKGCLKISGRNKKKKKKTVENRLRKKNKKEGNSNPYTCAVKSDGGKIEVTRIYALFKRFPRARRRDKLCRHGGTRDAVETITHLNILRRRYETIVSTRLCHTPIWVYVCIYVRTFTVYKRPGGGKSTDFSSSFFLRTLRPNDQLGFNQSRRSVETSD